MKINKAEFIKILREKIEFDTDIKLQTYNYPTLYKIFMSIIKEEIENGNDVSIPKLGVLENIQRSARNIYVPSVKKNLNFKKRASIRFVKSKNFLK